MSRRSSPNYRTGLRLDQNRKATGEQWPISRDRRESTWKTLSQHLVRTWSGEIFPMGGKASLRGERAWWGELRLSAVSIQKPRAKMPNQADVGGEGSDRRESKGHSTQQRQTPLKSVLFNAAWKISDRASDPDLSGGSGPWKRVMPNLQSRQSELPTGSMRLASSVAMSYDQRVGSEVGSAC